MRALAFVVGISLALFVGALLISYGRDNPVADFSGCPPYHGGPVCDPVMTANLPFMISGLALWGVAVVAGVLFSLTSLRRKPGLARRD